MKPTDIAKELSKLFDAMGKPVASWSGMTRTPSSRRRWVSSS